MGNEPVARAPFRREPAAKVGGCVLRAESAQRPLSRSFPRSLPLRPCGRVSRSVSLERERLRQALCGVLLGCCGCAGGPGTADVPGKSTEAIIGKLPRSAIVQARKEMLEAAVLSLEKSLGEPGYCDGFIAGWTYFRRLLLTPEPAVLYRHYVVDKSVTVPGFVYTTSAGWRCWGRRFPRGWVRMGQGAGFGRTSWTHGHTMEGYSSHPISSRRSPIRLRHHSIERETAMNKLAEMNSRARCDESVAEKQLLGGNLGVLFCLMAFSCMQGCGDATVLSFKGMKVGPRELARISAAKRLRTLDLSYSDVRDEDLSVLRVLPTLTNLEIQGSKVTDAGLTHLQSAENLRSLFLGSTEITDTGLAGIASLTKLKMLSVPETGITDAGLEHLLVMSELTSLDLRQTRVTDKGMAVVAKLKTLRQLILGRTIISDKGLGDLSGLVRLQELDVSGTRITDAGLEVLPRLQNLTTLDLCETRVTTAGIQHLARMKSLRALHVLHTALEPVKDQLKAAMPWVALDAETLPPGMIEFLEEAAKTAEANEQ